MYLFTVFNIRRPRALASLAPLGLLIVKTDNYTLTITFSIDLDTNDACTSVKENQVDIYRSTFLNELMPSWGGVTQWVTRPTRSISVVSSNHINIARYFLDQTSLPSLLIIIWIQERIQACFPKSN